MRDTIPVRKEIHTELTNMLNVHLANMYSLMLRLQYFHWNVEGPQFFSAHAIFEKYSKEIAEEVDITAERIRTLGEYAPGSLREFYELSQLTDRHQPLDTDRMFDDLITCCVVVREFCKETLKTAGLLVDEVTSDILIRQLALFEKAVWMFRSSLTRADKYDEDVALSVQRTSEVIPSQTNGNQESHV